MAKNFIYIPCKEINEFLKVYTADLPDIIWRIGNGYFKRLEVNEEIKKFQNSVGQLLNIRSFSEDK